MPRLLILCGLPGSGKSTLAARLTGWEVVNQDTLGDRQKCEQAACESLALGLDVIIDRCNFNRMQRATWIRLAHVYGAKVLGLQLSIPVEICVARAESRTDHLTLAPSNAAHVINSFYGAFEALHLCEGFSEVAFACNQADIDRFVARILQPSLKLATLAAAATQAAAQPQNFYFVPVPAQASTLTASGGALHHASPTHCVSHAHFAGVQSGRAGQQTWPKVEPGSVPPRWLDADLPPGDEMLIVLLDLNGTLSSHTSKRWLSHRTNIRPGVHHLRRLQGRCRLGIFTSATPRTVHETLTLLEAAAGPGPLLFIETDLILHRGCTVAAAPCLGGKAWDTIKPLSRWFSPPSLRRIVLVDDDALKAAPGEARNMIHVPCWDEDCEDRVLEALVTQLLQMQRDVEGGQCVQELTEAATAALRHDWLQCAPTGAPARVGAEDMTILPLLPNGEVSALKQPATFQA